MKKYKNKDLFIQYPDQFKRETILNTIIKKLFDESLISKSRVPFTYCYDCLRMSSVKLNRFSRSEIADKTNFEEYEYLSICIVYIFSNVVKGKKLVDFLYNLQDSEWLCIKDSFIITDEIIKELDK